MINEKTIFVEKLSQFIEWTSNLKESEGTPSFPVYKIFFRGHAFEGWKLQAGLFREENANVNEHECFRTANNRCWTEVSSFSNLEKFIYFQHFGLITRLLDITSNPLVALFFACQEYEINGDYKDGQVRYGYCDRDGFKTVNIIADIVANYDLSQIYPNEKWIQNLADSYNLKSAKILGELLSTPHYIDPPYNSTRIVAQRGALIMSPLLMKNFDEYIYVREYDFDNIPKENSLFGRRNVVIRHKYKKQILKELRNFGIDEYSIFPDTSHMMSAINREMNLAYE